MRVSEVPAGVRLLGQIRKHLDHRNQNAQKHPAWVAQPHARDILSGYQSGLGQRFLDKMPPRTQYTKSGNVSIAYQVLGDGPIDLVYAQGWITNVEYAWENPDYARFLMQLGTFSRSIRFDRRGMGLSDRDVQSLTLEERVDDIRAVMDAVGSERAALLGVSEGGYMSVMFAATHPERAAALVLCGCYAKGGYAPDYPWGLTAKEHKEKWIDELERRWGGPFDLEHGAPSVANDEAARSWFGAYLRYSASLSATKALAYQDHAVDVRELLPVVRVPTLVNTKISYSSLNSPTSIKIRFDIIPLPSLLCTPRSSGRSDTPNSRNRCSTCQAHPTSPTAAFWCRWSTGCVAASASAGYACSPRHDQRRHDRYPRSTGAGVRAWGGVSAPTRG